MGKYLQNGDIDNFNVFTTNGLIALVFATFTVLTN